VNVRAEIWCGRCTEEGRAQRGRLGAVVEWRWPLDPDRHPRLMWHGYDEPSARRLRNFRDDGVSDPPGGRHKWVELGDDAPEMLRVWCPRAHGAGWVRSADVRSARGSMPVAVAPR
jgi:hypothetical protein